MRYKDIIKLNIIKNKILCDVDNEHNIYLTDDEIFNEIDWIIDFENFDLTTISFETKQEAIEQLEGLIRQKHGKKRLETLFQYLYDDNSYELDFLLEVMEIDVDRFDTSTFNPEKFDGLTDELISWINYFDYEQELQAREEELASIQATYEELIRTDDVDYFDNSSNEEAKKLLEEKTKLLEEIKNLKDSHEKLLNSDKKRKTEEDIIKLKMAYLKEMIDEEEFTLMFKFSKEWQKKRRNQTKNPLPVLGTSKIDGRNVGKKNVRSPKVFYDRLEAKQYVKDYV